MRFLSFLSFLGAAFAEESAPTPYPNPSPEVRPEDAMPKPTLQEVFFRNIREHQIQDIATLQSYIDQGIDVHAQYGGKQTPLMTSCLTGNFDLLMILLGMGADENIGEMGNYKCLDGSGYSGHANITKYMLQHYPHLNRQHKDGFWPIHRACWGRTDGHVEAVKAFLEFGDGDLEVLTKDGKTPLEIARAKDHNPALIKVLEDAERAAGIFEEVQLTSEQAAAINEFVNGVPGTLPTGAIRGKDINEIRQQLKQEL